MTSAFRFCLWLLAASVLAFSGCEIETIVDDTSQRSPANAVVINEVFTLSLTEPTRYNWIEFLNAGSDTVELRGWTLEFTTYRYRTTIIVSVDTARSMRLLQIFESFSGYGRFRVPLTAFYQPTGPDDPSESVPLPPNGLLTIVDNESRMKDVTNWGPGNPRFQYEAPAFYSEVDSVDTLLYVPDSIAIISGGWNTHGFLLNTTEELVLRDPAGQVVDVVRYGNYQAPSPDPHPGNQTVGPIPVFESLCRYADGYKTNPPYGNTANDFFVTDQYIRPVPHWYSQPHKR